MSKESVLFRKPNLKDYQVLLMRVLINVRANMFGRRQHENIYMKAFGDYNLIKVLKKIQI